MEGVRQVQMVVVRQVQMVVVRQVQMVEVDLLLERPLGIRSR